MIQRVQTLFLFAVVLISILLFFVPISEKTYIDSASGKEVKLELSINKMKMDTGDGIPTSISTIPLLLINLVILAAAAFIIFLYSNRNAQMKLCMLTSLIVLVFLILTFYYSENMGPETSKAHYLAGIYLIAVEVFLILAARRFIRKDDLLVKSADRIR